MKLNLFKATVCYMILFAILVFFFKITISIVIIAIILGIDLALCNQKYKGF